MTDFAKLTLDADTAGLAVAVDVMKDVQGEAQKTEAVVDGAMDGLGKGFGGAGRGAKVVSSGMTGISRSSAGAAGSLRGVALQLNQVAQVGAVTGNWLGALMVQMPDILGAFGTFGVVAGIAAGVLTPFIVSLMDSAKSVDDLREELDALEETLKTQMEAAELAGMSTAELGERFGTAAGKIRTTLDILDQIASSEAQRAIDGIAQSMAELLGTGGGGEQRTAIADFFNVDIFFAFTAAQRQVRDEARQLTAEFLNAQKALEESNGDIVAQFAAMQRLVAAANALADADGRRTAEEENLIKLLGETSVKMGEQAGKVEDTEEAQIRVNQRLAAAYGLYANLRTQAAKVADETERAADAAFRLAQQQLAAAGKVYSGRGGDPRTSNQQGYGEFVYSGDRLDANNNPVVKGGGGGALDPYKDDLEALQTSLMTQRQVVDQWYEDGLVILNDRRAQELLTKQEHADLLFAIDQEYALRKLQLDEATGNSEVEMRRKTVDLLASTFTALGQHSKAAAVAAVALNAAKSIRETIHHTAVAVMRAMAELGPIAGPPAAARIKAMGAVQVGLIAANAALSFGGRGGRGGGGGVSAIGSAPRQQQAEIPTQTLHFAIQNDSFGIGEGIIRQIVAQLNSASRNGSNIRATVSA